jgi:hypothetical protein
VRETASVPRERALGQSGKLKLPLRRKRGLALLHERVLGVHADAQRYNNLS